MGNAQDLRSVMMIIWPLIAIQLVVQIYAIVDLLKKGRTKNLSLAIWLIIIVLGELVGALLYLLIGRSEE